MQRLNRLMPVAAVCMLAVATPSMANTITFSNPAPITIPAGDPNASGPGSPYPSNILVAGFSGLTVKVTATLYGLSHTFADDLDFLLVSPTGLKSILMSDAGGPFGLSAVNLTFDDAASASLPDNTAISSGSYKPTDYDAGDLFPAPAPPGAATASMANFNGVGPNGTWGLFAFDDAGADAGVVAGGWSLTISDDAVAPPPVPEPASLFMLGIGAAAVIRRRRSARTA